MPSSAAPVAGGSCLLVAEVGVAFMLLVVFAAMFTQGLVGFGSAMVSMALLPEPLGLSVAGPLVALMALPSEGLVLIRYRRSLNWRAVARLAAGMVVV